MAMADHRHRRASEIGLRLDDAAVVQIAVEHRLLAGIELLAHRGVDAVGADQDVGFVFGDRLAGWIGETRDHLAAALLEACQAVARHHRVGAEPLA